MDWFIRRWQKALNLRRVGGDHMIDLRRNFLVWSESLESAQAELPSSPAFPPSFGLALAILMLFLLVHIVLFLPLLVGTWRDLFLSPWVTRSFNHHQRLSCCIAFRHISCGTWWKEKATNEDHQNSGDELAYFKMSHFSNHLLKLLKLHRWGTSLYVDFYERLFFVEENWFLVTFSC